MNIKIEPGIYVVAVSGGVDSMVLLDLLAKKPNLKLIVAHFDHGIRPDSEQDRRLVQTEAAKYKLPLVFNDGKLGPKASEAKAREARYNFLYKVKKASSAKAIITAHHQDDLIETAIINMLRGTNRKGLSSLKSQEDILRPLLNYQKPEILVYAKKHNIDWREDSTNADTNYLRNYVRLQIVPKLSKAQKQQLLEHINNLTRLNKDIDNLLEGQLKGQKDLDKQWFLSLAHDVARETMAAWLRQNQVTEIDKKRLELLVRAAKTYKNGKKMDVDKTHVLEVGADKLALVGSER